jgi:hypothetical protein
MAPLELPMVTTNAVQPPRMTIPRAMGSEWTDLGSPLGLHVVCPLEFPLSFIFRTVCTNCMLCINCILPTFCLIFLFEMIRSVLFERLCSTMSFDKLMLIIDIIVQLLLILLILEMHSRYFDSIVK